MARNFPPETLNRSMAHFARPSGPDLLGRTTGYFTWQDRRRKVGLWPYSRALMTAAGPHCSITDDAGNAIQGINFASQDYLSLSSHPAVCEAAVEAIREFGVHSAGSAVLLGNTRHSLCLEQALAEHLKMKQVVLYPTGWGAGFGVIKGLVRPDDHVVLDALAHACLQEGAAAATQKVHRFGHLDTDDLGRLLRNIRASDTQNGILVVTEGLFSMDSDKPDLKTTQALCREFDAILVVDVAHDLGATGPDGTGTIGAQGMLGKIDLVMGSFSKTFASNGGFVATHHRSVKEYLQAASGPYTFSNALGPSQAACIYVALSIIRSSGGAELRAALAGNIRSLRLELELRGVKCLGDDSPIVPAWAGSEKVARIASALVAENALLTNLVEFPAVPVGRARFRLQVMAEHRAIQITSAASILADAVAQARELVVVGT